ncbi:uncharacterized protein LOC114445951 [Parambassis ranga]|uniref:Uncharacterized protein LOC114445951 n=1 Tax=Parambassis ranga TaxID=210632 RepID=A0A6P7JJS2_9TELE|nr:uncharacterized protein LOC114445951 [Parambassis ranga]XP_028277107.1 uncharacterized protein LOC114445951 [Parambassis ranga]
MGNAHTIFNETQYRWYYRTHWREDTDRTLPANGSGEYLNTMIPFVKVYLRFRDHTDWDLKCEGGGPSYTLRESADHKQFELVNNFSGFIVDRCPNFGKLEEEEQENERQRLEREKRQKEEKQQKEEEEKRRKEEEEKRRLAELEQERKIQEQINQENEASRRKLSEAHQRFEEDLRSQQHRQQQYTQVLHQVVENHAAKIERDELNDVRRKFEELLSNYHIVEKADSKCNLENRMKTLQNELVLNYFGKHRIPLWCQLAVDRATGYLDLSPTERLSVVEAVVKVTVDCDPDLEDVLITEQDKKIVFLLSLQEQLYDENPTLARTVLVNVLDMTSQLTSTSKELLSQILFNNIWTPKEIKLFIRRALSMDQNNVFKILHKVCTYRLSFLHTLTALKKKHHVQYLQDCVSYELDKDPDTILSEMQDKNYPKHTLSLLEDILMYMEDKLPELQGVVIDAEMIEEGKRMMILLDLAEPDVDTLKKVLIVLSLAVKECTTFIAPNGNQIQGYFPRLTQLASLLLLLRDKRGCLLEISTGEGKTCILAMFATIQAARGTMVDIVTSSPLLAIRDQDKWSQLYQMFGVTSSIVPPAHFHTCTPENQDKLLQDAYTKHVVYSTASTFAPDILRQEFEKKTTRGRRKFECVLVDEVDYMTLDSGVQTTFLSHQASGLRHMEQILASIWALLCTCRPIEVSETGEIQWGTRAQHFHEAATQSVVSFEDCSADSILMLGVQLGFYSQEDMDRLTDAKTQTGTDSCEDAMRKATEKIMDKMGPKEQYELLSKVQTTADNDVTVDYYSVINNKAKLYGKEDSQRPGCHFAATREGASL